MPDRATAASEAAEPRTSEQASLRPRHRSDARRSAIQLANRHRRSPRISKLPAAPICAGYDDDGLPIGLQIVGHRFDDAGVMMLAHSYEALRLPMRPWPDPA